MDNTEIAERLAGMDDAYENVTDGRPEEGTYQAIIERFDFFEAKKTGDLFMKTELRIVHDQDWDGAQVAAIHNLTDEDKIRWTKKYLAVIGYLQPISQLMTNLDSFVGVPVEIAVKYSDKVDEFGDNYQNVWVNRRLGEAVGPSTDVPGNTASFATTPVDDSDVPF
jgi:hypothetical protein